MAYKDFSFNVSDYSEAEEFTTNDSLVLAVRNILLSRPGNFPFNPSLGMNIEKYMFDIMDDITVNNIKVELAEQLNKYLPGLNNIQVDVSKLEDESGKGYLGIHVASIVGDKNIGTNFLLRENSSNGIDIINETY